jgi:hypothetical protein
VAAYFVWVVAIAPLENPHEELVAVRPWLLVLGPLLAALALVFAGATIARNLQVMTAAWLVDSLATGGLLFYGLTLDFSPTFKALLTLGALAVLVSGGIASGWSTEGQT